MPLWDITNRSAVEQAIAEFDQLGQQAFLHKYGFGPARSFFINHNGRQYDSKAIVGAAHGYQHGKLLRAVDFSGGEQTVVPLLEGLGFRVERGEPAQQELVVGEVYRRTVIHDQFGGQRQGGISTPAGEPVILLFTGSSGPQHGYDDGWVDGVFCYFGEGQVGNMPWVRGNQAVRDHAANGRDLMLFEMLKVPRSHVRYLGQFALASYEYREAPDRLRHIRRSIVFHLVRQQVIVLEQRDKFIRKQTDLLVLRKTAYEIGKDTPASSTRNVLQTYIERSAAVRDYALARAEGRCERCTALAPFTTETGAPFLEVHHIHRLTDGGLDRPDTVAAICPNCHREAHHGSARKELNRILLDKIRVREDAL